MADIEIEIDGKKLQANPDAMVMQVADAAGIYIPRFCYHKHLSIAANCRMCLVEVEKAPKPMPACATPVMPGMKVFTRSAKALAAQKAVMEFLLINHPLDCPICDQGGECELQDLAMGYGPDKSFYHEGKRSVKDKDIGPLISTEMTRCIQCTRCVRFGAETAGFRELGATGRGERMEIGTYIQHAMESEVSGNIIDLCPVGALTSKPFRFTARAWELEQYPSIAAHDCLGSNIYVHTLRGKVMRVVPHENDEINQTWISDRDRYSYEGLNHEDRLEKPRIRKQDGWQETDWQTALEFATQGLQRVLNAEGGNELAALASPNSTLEEFYLLQKLLRSLGSSNIDHRLRQSDFSDQETSPIFPGLDMPIADLENRDVIVLLGCNLQKEEPIASLKVRKAALKGAKIIVVNMMDYDFHFNVSHKKIIAPHQFVDAVKELTNDPAIAEIVRNAKSLAVLLGAQSLNHLESSSIRFYAEKIASLANGTVGLLTEGCNAAGAWIAGAIPHRTAAGKPVSKIGLNAETILTDARKAYILLNVEPDLDCANSIAAINALDQAECVIALSTFKNPVLEQLADVILPVAPFTETSGTFVNAEGKWQKFKGVVTPLGETRPAWKVLRVMANFLKCEGFEFESSEKVREEVHELFLQGTAGASSPRPSRKEHPSPAALRASTSPTRGEVRISRVGEIPIYSGDNIQRRAKALQATQPIIEGNVAVVKIHPLTAEKLHLKEMEPAIIKQFENRIRLTVIFDTRVPENAAYIAGGITATSGLSQLFGPVEIHKA